jgi:ssDNA-binding Zn-finger/Zn-ribbon topoisomerase 1
MAQPDFSNIFSCPRCGTTGAIYLLKVAGNKMIIKQRCPKHGGRSYKLPLIQKEQFIPNIRDAVFRCYKCGQEVKVDSLKMSGPWTLFKGVCPVHGNKLPYQKIWSTVFTEISRDDVSDLKSQLNEKKNVSEEVDTQEIKVCPNCGSPLRGIEKYCGFCGSEI